MNKLIVSFASILLVSAVCFAGDFAVDVTVAAPAPAELFYAADGNASLDITGTWAAAATTGGIRIDRQWGEDGPWSEVDLWNGNTARTGIMSGGSNMRYRAVGVNMTAGTAHVQLHQRP